LGLPEARHATELKWVRPNQMYALEMPPADLPLIGLLDSLI
jgi:8-oxo-dGTP diphosphatase